MPLTAPAPVLDGPMFPRKFFLPLGLALLALGAGAAQARPALVIDAATGRVLHAEEATRPWFPASLTKLMTTYVVFDAIRAGRVSLDTPLVYSARAAAERPSKMGFKVGTVVTIDNALKMLMVKSANDIAVVIAEGVGGSVEAFARQMNSTAARLGMTQSHFTNPNGWWDPHQVTTARDMAILARALLTDFPQHANFYNIRALQLGKKIIRGHNPLLGRYEGADGMKTGFTCPSGFNLVATAARGDRRLITVVLGHSSARERTERAAQLLERAFGAWTFWRTGQDVASLPGEGGEAPNLREEVCGKKRGGPAAVGEQEESEDGTVAGVDPGHPLSGLLPLRGNNPRELLSAAPPAVPVRIFLGPNPKARAMLAAGGQPIRADAGAPLDIGKMSGAAFAASSESPLPGLKARVPMPMPRPSRL